ncbi:MAG: hypothetical protein U5R30_14010 [Deltaproteobacteria bacterium]|nr:hypothetical protein [Deltaproteobacteria bacterium]
MAQVAALLGSSDWLAHDQCRAPVILCGDFNALPLSSVCRRLAGRRADVQIEVQRGRCAGRRAANRVAGELFRIRDDVPGDLRHGVFRRPLQSFQAIVRFSNASETIGPDGNVDARGMAIKLLGVEGTPAIPERARVLPFSAQLRYLDS